MTPKLRLAITWEDHDIRLLGYTIRVQWVKPALNSVGSSLSHLPPFWVPFCSWATPATLTMLAVCFSLMYLLGGSRNAK